MEALDRMAYCPACGSARFEVDGPKSRRCAGCGYEWFANPAAAVAAFITNSRGELLVERRRLDPAKGTLDLPGGFADAGETAERAVAREVEEETGLAVYESRYLFSLPNRYEYGGTVLPTLDMFFACSVEEGAEPVAADDAAECLWVPMGGIDPAAFGLASIRRGVELYLSMRSGKP